MTSNQSGHLVLDYRPSEFTGWEWGKTIGGHHRVKEFKLAGRHYQIGLLAFGQCASSPNPVYEPVPGDPTIAFKRTLERKFGADYSFRYRGEFKGQNEFRVPCYSVFAAPQQMSFGPQLYIVYEPDVHAGDPAAQAQLKWIQVAHWSGTGSPSPALYLDNTWVPRIEISPPLMKNGFGHEVFNFRQPDHRATLARPGRQSRSLGQIPRRNVPRARHPDQGHGQQARANARRNRQQPSSAAQPRLASADHLAADCRPSQPTGWPPERHARNGVGVTIGGHVASVPFTIQATSYEISLLAFGQPGNAPNPLYEREPSDPTIDFKGTLQKAWGACYSFNCTGGFTSETAISVQSYSVKAIQQTADQASLSCDLFLVYEPDPASSDPPITADLRWTEVTYTGGRSSTEFAQRACPLLLPRGAHIRLRQAGVQLLRRPRRRDRSPDQRQSPDHSQRSNGLRPSHVRELPRARHRAKDHAGKGIIDILGGVKWGYQLQAAQS